MAAIELGVPYYLYTPDKSQYCALNAPADSNFVGYVTDITGIDDSGVRENAQVVVAGDGGHHGPFWRDRRPWTMSGIIMPIFPLLARDQAQETLEGIIGQAMMSDGFLTWTPADGIQRMLPFRKQQAVRIGKGQSNVEKTFQLAAVTADFRVVSWQTSTISSSGGSLTATNQGNADASPLFVAAGLVGSTTYTITNTTTGKVLSFTTPSTVNSPWTIDLTGAYPSVTDNAGNDQYGQINVLSTDWTIAVAGTRTVSGGTNTFTISGTGTTLTLTWRHSWL